MSFLEKYNSAFVENFNVEPGDLPSLKYQAIPAWDSVGHMALMNSLEETFGIELDIDDIIDFSSYEVGKAILAKYKISIESAA